MEAPFESDSARGHRLRTARLLGVATGAVVLALVTTKVPLFASQMLGAGPGFSLRSLFVEGQ